MANEITINATVRAVNGSFNFVWAPGAVQVDQTTPGVGPGLVSVGTSEETIAFGDVTPNYVLIQNLDTTNYVEVGPDSTGMVALVRLEAGEIAIFPMTSGVTLKAQANTAACNVMFQGLNT